MRVFLLVTAALLASLAIQNLPAQAQSTTNLQAILKEYDSNQNNRLDDPEFFVLIDDWIASKISNEVFFAATDFWVGDRPLAAGPQPEPSPPTQTASCPTSAQLIGMRDGRPFGNYPGDTPEAGLSTPIWIAFDRPVFLPRGTSVEITTISNTPGLEPREAALLPPVTDGSFASLGALQIVGRGVIRSNVDVPAQHEWAQFTPYWHDSASAGSFHVEASFIATGCAEVRMAAKITIRKVTAAPAADALLIQSLGDRIVFSAGVDGPIQVEIFDLSGKSVYRSPLSASVALAARALGSAQGIYLYVIRARSKAGLAPIRVGRLYLGR